ncbi:MAG: 23S rRNA (uracil(1939)-C(5))-methyltransferase RlmD [Clostridia bacterium]|nr:23S rRNA (uracil(1939)-C(5))-methyltransferase RlmD [Clostridia bacterium]
MIELNKIYEAEITSYGSTGEGVCRIDGFAVFVPQSAAGDKIKVRITKLHKSYARGEIAEIITPSPCRTEPLCRAFGECGGCNLMHIDYQAQLKFKHDKVASAFKKIGGFNDITVSDVVPSPEVFRYRNKVNVPVYSDGDNAYAGFYKGRTHEAVKNTDCLLQDKSNAAVINAVAEYINKTNAAVNHIYIRTAQNRIMVSLECDSPRLHDEDTLVTSLLEANGNISSVILNSKKPRAIYGELYLTDEISGIKFRIHHDSFYQINKGVCELLYKNAIDLLGDMRGKTVFDVYCGIGTISLHLAKKAKSVTGIEYLPHAVKDARENARLNGISNAVFYAGDAAKVLHDLFEGGDRADYVVLDPPRKGCDKALLETLGKMSPEKIVYISCDCATLARDAKVLTALGYSVRSVTPFDMFPQTHHIETAALLSRAGL